VSDDGLGVPAGSRHALALPHATSKIGAFADIYANTGTLGFRGEALSSLAGLSTKLVIATRCAGDAAAHRLEFNRDGSVACVSEMPRKVGTTVAVLGLLSALPVRRKELEGRIKQHRSKLLHLVSQYATFSTGVRIHLMEMVQDKSGKGGFIQEKTLLATPYNTISLQQTVSAIHGPKLLSSLCDITIDLTLAVAGGCFDDGKQKGNDEPPTADEDATDNAAKPPPKWKVQGLISSANMNTSSLATTTTATAARHKSTLLFAINRRPVDLPKVARILSECYPRFDKMPSCTLDFTLPGSAYDINLSPDKRQVIFTHETEIIDAIRSCLHELWSSQSDGVQFAVKPTLAKLNATPASAIKEKSEDCDGDDDDDEMGDNIDVSGSSRLYHRRYGFVHDPTMAVAKEHDEGQKRIEYYSSSPERSSRKTRRSNFEMTQIIPRKEKNDDNNDNETPLGTDDGTQMRALRASIDDSGALSPNDDKEGARIASSGERRRMLRVQIGSDLAANTPVDVSKTVTPSPSNYAALNIDTEEPCTSRYGEQHQHDQIHHQTSLHGNCTEEMSAEPAVEDPVPWSEQRHWRQIQEKFNRRTGDTANLLLSAKPQDVSAQPLRIHAKRSFGLERFGCGSVAKVWVAPPLRSFLQRPDDYSTGQKSSESDPARGIDTQKTATSSVPGKRHSSIEVQRREAAIVLATDDHNRKPAPVLVQRQQTRQVSMENENEIPGGSSTSSNVWSSFGLGTDEIILATMKNRLSMRDRKRKHCTLGNTSEGTAAADDTTSEEVATLRSEPSSTTPEQQQQAITLSKGDFQTMQVIGQFNMGFILAKTAEGNLWILDQHSCDEKYNFEKLVRETVIHEQKLIAPLPLDLSSTEENIVMENLEMFESNGFRFAYDESKPPRHRLSLTALPHSGASDGRKAVQYGVEDVSALCSILGAFDGADNDNTADDDMSSSQVRRQQVSGGTGVDGSGMYGNNAVRRYAAGPGIMGSQCSRGSTADKKMIVRLPKTIAMFASRACRTSIMIGKALSEKEMEKIVRRLSDLEQPYTCPHGRPTIRHAAGLQGLVANDEARAEEHVAGPATTIQLGHEEDDDVSE
jgi:DNA mismatch repair protein PMS2